ncbi:class I SAM-dependent methyltransferase [Salisaeta longa]|uniref:class I SAM-dependent methyltransferase n=1 Tax=Salisaeta longa TaxID=503170 RepID=UPI0003B5EA4D|nr:class I SAM-dependent methyltransferase [Salisaeta longa]
MSSSATARSPRAFWDEIFSEGHANPYSRVAMPDLNEPNLQQALQHFGNVEGRTLIDVGCGRGSASLFFAYHGAHVISVDASAVAIDNLATYCTQHGIHNITPVCCTAEELTALDTRADFVYGAMILHHVEPFAAFVRTLRRVMKPNGRAFFWENNGRNPLLMWFRRHVVGRGWIPKFGDAHEIPLTPDEVSQLDDHFSVSVRYPELLLFRMISFYLLKGSMGRAMHALDRFFYRFPAIRRHSYRQHIYLEAS